MRRLLAILALTATLTLPCPAQAKQAARCGNVCHVKHGLGQIFKWPAAGLLKLAMILTDTNREGEATGGTQKGQR